MNIAPKPNFQFTGSHADLLERQLLRRFMDPNAGIKEGEIAEFEKKKRPLSPQESAVFELVEKITSQFLINANVEDFKIGKDNVWILSKQECEDRYGTDATGFFDSRSQKVIICDGDLYTKPEGLFCFATLLLHEFLHAKSFYRVHLGKGTAAEVQIGLLTEGKDALDEAIIVAGELHFIDLLLTEPNVAKSYEYILAKRKTKEFAALARRFWIPVEEVTNEEIDEVVDNDTEQTEGFYSGGYKYPDARRLLEFVLHTVTQDVSRGNFWQTYDKVFMSFFNARLSGDTAEIKRLIDNSFGQGVFDEYMKLNYEKGETEVFFDKLITNRREGSGVI